MKSNTAPIRKLEPVIWTDALQHGIRLQYYMPSLKLGFTAELTIEKNCLQIHIPAESVGGRRDSLYGWTPHRCWARLRSEAKGIIFCRTDRSLFYLIARVTHLLSLGRLQPFCDGQ